MREDSIEIMTIPSCNPLVCKPLCFLICHDGLHVSAGVMPDTTYNASAAMPDHSSRLVWLRLHAGKVL
jgi:hypothetical protein